MSVVYTCWLAWIIRGLYSGANDDDAVELELRVLNTRVPLLVVDVGDETPGDPPIARLKGEVG